MADAINFDPSTAAPAQSSGFDPSSATPVTETRTDGFDPSSARPIDDHLRDVANDVLARHHAGEAELDDESLKGLVEQAYKDRTPFQGVKDWAIGVASGIAHPSGIYDKIKSGLSTAGKAAGELGDMVGTIGEQEPSAPEKEQASLSASKNLAAGAASAPLDLLNVGQSLGIGAANLVDQGLPGSHERRIDRIVRSEKLAHDINASVKGVNEYLGADPSDPLNESTRFLAQAFLPIKGAGEVSGPIAKAADVAVENAPIAARWGAPAAGGVASTALGHPTLAKEIVAAGYGLPTTVKTIRTVVKKVKEAAGDTSPESTSLFNDFVDAASKAPSQTPMFTYIKQGVDDRIASLQKVTEDFRSANQGKIKFADDPTVDVKDLKGPDKELREKLDQMKFLRQRSDKLKTASDVNKVLTYGGKLSLATAGNVVAGGAIMGGISASQAQPQQVEQAAKEGFQTGAALSLPFAPLQAHGALQDLRMTQGRDALEGRGAKIVDPKSLEGLTDAQKTNVLTTAGAADSVGVKTVVLSPEEYAQMIAPQRPEVVPAVEGAPQEQQVTQQAPNGHYDPNTKTIYLNRAAIGEGTAGHELQHPLQQLWGQMLRENDPSWVKTYDELLAKTGQTRTTSSQSERDAEVGRELLRRTPIEAFYSGESGADVVKRVVSNLLQKIAPSRYSETIGTTDLGAPYSRGDLGEMSQRMFRLGEEAAKAPRTAPVEPQATSVPQAEQQQPTAPIEAPTKPVEQVVSEVDKISSPKVIPAGGVDPQDAVDFLVKMGQTKEGAEAKAHAAVQDLKGEGTPITLENIVKKAMQRSIPKPVDLVSEVDQVVRDLTNAKTNVASKLSGSTESRSATTQGDVASQNELGNSVSGADRKATSESNASSAQSPFEAELFHGSPNLNLDEISASPSTRQYDNATSALGAFFHESPNEASRYAGESGKVYPVKIKLNNPKEMNWNEFSYFQNINKAADGSDIPSSQWGDRAEELKQEATQFRKQLESQGYDGIVVRGRRGNPIEVSSFKNVSVSSRGQVAKSGVASTKSDTNPVVSAETPFGVTQAAVKTRDGQIFTGVNHADAASKMVKAGYKTNELYDWNQQGFVRNGEWIGGPEAEKLALDMPGNAKSIPQTNEEPSRTPTETVPQETTEPAPERGVESEVQAPAVQAGHPDYQAIRTQAEAAKRQELAGTRRKTKEQEISRAGLEAMAQAHAKHVGDTDLVTWRTDRFGDTSIGGKRLDLDDPFHQHLIEKAGLTPKQVEYVNQFSDNMGKLLGLENYSHAAKEGEATGISRKAEQKESTAQQRAEKQGDTQNAPVNIVPTWIKFNQPSNRVTVHGFNVNKMLANGAKLESYPESGFKKAYPKGVNDPQIIQDLNDWLANNRNGWTGDGRKQIEGTPLTQVKPNPDYKPVIIPHDRFQVLNAMMGSPEPMGKTSKSADAQILGQQNAGFVRPQDNSFNQVRAKLGEEAGLLENVNESLRPENISGKVSNDPVADEHLLRPSGAKPDTVKAIADVIGEKGTPRFSQSGFMPNTTDPRAIKEPTFKLADGRIISAPVGNHSFIEFPKGYEGEYIVGFVTNSGEFLERKEAFDRAKELGQINRRYEKEFNRIFGSDKAGQLEGETFRDNKQFMPSTPKHLAAVAKQNGLIYNGEMEGKLHLFSDPQSKTTFSVPINATPEQLQKKLEVARQRMGGEDVQFMPSTNPKAIKEAAIKMPDDKIFSDFVHPLAYAEALSSYSTKQLTEWLDNLGEGFAVTGFVTNDGEFLTRDQALQRGKELKQFDDKGIKEAKEHFGDLRGGSGLEALNFLRARKFSLGGVVARSPLSTAKTGNRAA